LTPNLGANIGNRLFLEEIVGGSLRSVVLGHGALLLLGQALNGGIPKLLVYIRDIVFEGLKSLSRLPSQARHRLRIIFRLLGKAAEFALVLLGPGGEVAQFLL
jgi:hypothetical protein